MHAASGEEVGATAWGVYEEKPQRLKHFDTATTQILLYEEKLQRLKHFTSEGASTCAWRVLSQLE